MNRMAKVILWCLLTALLASAVGCNTLHGAGRDVEQAGEAVQRATD